ncbi:ATP synthase F1 subunit epsilon [Salinisphaera sp. PC39]|uniref:F0F1 ATP synthase subunit epsilon n=1 Tax=Salinisphaera sp. PC39 TaxID=1304156 RepID=UPI00334174A7
MKLHVDIVSAEGQIHSGSANMVYAPAEMGEVGIAPRHAPLLTRLKPGQVRIEDLEGQEQVFFVSGGVLEVQPHLVTVLADTAARAHDIDEAEAEKAKQRAEEALSEAHDKVDMARAQAELAEAAARLHVVKQLRGTSSRR